MKNHLVFQFYQILSNFIQFFIEFSNYPMFLVYPERSRAEQEPELGISKKHWIIGKPNETYDKIG